MNFDWPGMTAIAFWYAQRCPECQQFHKNNRRILEIPVGIPVVVPWVVLTGLWTIPISFCGLCINPGGNINDTSEPKLLQLTCWTIIDLATQWIGMVCINEIDACIVAKAFDCAWLSWYPHLLWCVHDQGSEFVVCKFQELLDSYGIVSSPITV
jgi:hypothetical protein